MMIFDKINGTVYKYNNFEIKSANKFGPLAVRGGTANRPHVGGNSKNTYNKLTHRLSRN